MGAQLFDHSDPLAGKATTDAGTTPPSSIPPVDGVALALETRSLAVAEIDSMGRIAWASPLFARTVNRDTASIVGVDVRTIWPRSKRTTYERVWRFATEKREFAWQGEMPDGTMRTWRLILPPAQSSGFLWIERDNTAGDATELERLRELNEMRIHFINTAAHEFATPLTPLRLQTTLLLEQKLGPLTDRQIRSLEILDRNMERLGQLVRDVLDVSRIEAGRFQVSLEPIDLAQLARQAVESFLDPATQAGVTLQFEGPEGLAVEGDKDRLTQVFVNLVSNALKFTPRGGKITVTMSANDGNAQVVVEDTGQGIPVDKIGRLFQPFSQVHDTSQETRAGTGLGLSICQGIVSQHGGRIWAESHGLGAGSKFSFLIPLAMETPMPSADVGPGPHKLVRVDTRGRWNLFYFKCPDCGSRDIEIRLLKNRYDCNQCKHSWK